MGKMSLVCLFAFCAFAWLRLCAFWDFWCFWCVLNLFVKKGFKTALITSFILLLKFILLQAFFNHNPFQLSQSFSIITVLFNYHNLFQLSQSFSIITFFFNYHDFFSIIATLFNYHDLFYYNLFYQSLFESLQLVTPFLGK